MQAETDQRSKGLAILRTFAGDDYVQRRQQTTTPFNSDLRALSEHCLGAVWARPGLPMKVRSMLCMAMLTATGRTDELRIHINGAFNNGCTVEEVKEVILQCVIYCGFPAAGEANRICEQIMLERGLGSDQDSSGTTE